jgi:hypothetical protein
MAWRLLHVSVLHDLGTASLSVLHGLETVSVSKFDDVETASGFNISRPGDCFSFNASFFAEEAEELISWSRSREPLICVI